MRAHGASEATAAALDQDPVGGVGKAQHVAGDLLDEIGVRLLGGQERDVTRETGPHGFEALEFEREERGALDELQASLEAVPAAMGMMGEIGRQSETDERNESLPDETRTPGSPIMLGVTQHRIAHSGHCSIERIEFTVPTLKTR